MAALESRGIIDKIRAEARPPARGNASLRNALSAGLRASGTAMLRRTNSTKDQRELSPYQRLRNRLLPVGNVNLSYYCNCQI
jgi:hypothetical protein